MRHRSFSSTVRLVARAAANAEYERARAFAQAERNRQRALQEAARQAKVDAREAIRDRLASQIEKAEALSKGVQEQVHAAETLLARALAIDPAIDLQARLRTFAPAKFNERAWPSKAPPKVLPKDLGFFGRLIPGASARHREEIEKAELQHRKTQADFEEVRRKRDAAFAEFQRSEEARMVDIERENTAVRERQLGIQAADHAAVISYFQEVIDSGLNGDPDAVSVALGYSPESKHLVADLELPDLSVIPEELGFKYVKTSDRIDPVPRPVAKRKALYSHLICQVALKCVDAVFRGGAPVSVVGCLTVNGMLDSVDPATGQCIRVCLLSVRITADTFGSLNLAQVDPEHCLRSLKASVSRAPAELLPVRPLVELNMVDPRFIETMDVMSGLDQRPNLMELSPAEFEGLITNLFAAMGLDTRQTQSSRDGGVDCVAFDSRPVFGGKVVIQAKRYKNTVGVSAVRDLFGTVQNEGASKGILVTTSGYGRASFEFAKGKPLELLDGGNLLHLLSEHAGLEAKIVPPEDWVDLPTHGE